MPSLRFFAAKATAHAAANHFHIVGGEVQRGGSLALADGQNTITSLTSLKTLDLSLNATGRLPSQATTSGAAVDLEVNLALNDERNAVVPSVTASGNLTLADIVGASVPGGGKTATPRFGAPSTCSLVGALGSLTIAAYWRSSGIIALVLLVLSVVWGVLLATRALKPYDRPAWLLDLHRWLGGTALVMTGLHLFGLGFSWGGFESLAISCDPQLASRTAPVDLGGPLIRLHIGLESPTDLIADLRTALDVYSA